MIDDMDIRQANFNNLSTLTNEVKKGKEAAFDFLFRTRYKGLCRFAFSFVNDFNTAEDIVQDVFSVVWQKCGRLDEDKSVDSYLYVAVRNACFTYLRDKHEKVNIEELKQEVVLPEEVVEMDTPELKCLWMAVEGLPLQCKVIFKLVVLEEMKYKEVADILDVSVNTVKTQMKIAYKLLREKLGRARYTLLLLFLRECFSAR